MRLYVIRHADAEDVGARGDRSRNLTAKGVARAVAIADAFGTAHPPLDRRPVRIFSSPAVRAVQTAAPIARCLNLGVEEDPRLGTDADEREALGLIRECVEQGHSAVVIVGHNPTLATLGQGFTGEPGMRKGEVLSVELAGASLRAIPHGRLTPH